jgi:hypothetical protein
MEPRLGFELHASTLAAATARAVDLGVAGPNDVTNLVTKLRTANPADYHWVSTPFCIDLTLRKPQRRRRAASASHTVGGLEAPLAR